MNKTVDDMLADVSENDISVDETQLSTLAQLSEKQAEYEQAITNLEAQIKQQKEELQRLKTGTIPDFMDEIGMQSFTLKDGRQISVEPFYQGSIKEAKKAEAHQWLIDNGYGDIIKATVTVTLPREEFEYAQELCDELSRRGYNASSKMAVHGMTLKGWIRMMSEEGEDFPHDLFGAYIGRVAKIS